MRINRRYITFAAELLAPGAGSYASGHRYRALAVLGAELGALSLGVVAGVRGMPKLFQLSLAVAILVRLAGLIVRGVGPKLKGPSNLTVTAVCVLWLVSAVAARAALGAHVVDFYKASSRSMYPTLSTGDRVAVSKLAAPLHRADLVALHPPDDPTDTWVKRVIGLPGDRVRCDLDAVVVNGKPLPRFVTGEPCLETPPCSVVQERLGDTAYLITVTSPPDPLKVMSEIEIPAGHVFVLGDNRDNSLDSRSFGPVVIEDIVGHLTMKWWTKGHQ